MLALIAVPLVAAAALAAPPEPRFTLEGRVLDTTGAVVAAAEVRAVSLEQANTLSARTNEKGEFTLLLPRGSYTVRASAPSFVDAVESVTARDDGRESRDFVLKVAPFGETVTVRAPRQYDVDAISTATKTLTPLRDVPQSVTVVTKELIQDQLMMSIGDVVRYVPGITAAPGREQPRPGDHPRQQLVGRLLRERRARRRAVLPRPLQPRARRGAEGPERDDLRPRRRRRRRQPRDQGGRVPPRPRDLRCRAARYGHKRVTRRPRPAAQRHASRFA